MPLPLPIYISLRKLHTCARARLQGIHTRNETFCAFMRTWLPYEILTCDMAADRGAFSNFANVILSVISGLMLVSDFGSSKITANHFAVEFLSSPRIPRVFDVTRSCRFSCTLCIGATSMRTCILRISQTTGDLCRVIGWRLTRSLVIV